MISKIKSSGRVDVQITKEATDQMVLSLINRWQVRTRKDAEGRMGGRTERGWTLLRGT